MTNNKIPLQWNVLYHSINKNKITTFNIFDHCSFAVAVVRILSTVHSKEEFAKEIRKELQYYFWSKCEYEIIISPWPPRGKPREKIDVYEQIVMNWDIFVDYIWNKKDLLCLFEEGLYYENP